MFKKRTRVVAIACVLVLVLVTLLAVACEEEKPAALTVAPTSVEQGGTITVTGANFKAGENVTIAIGAVTLGTATADGGAFTAADLTVGTDVAAGAATVTATGDKQSSATASLTVTEAAK